jgi:hypothetical protein
VIQQRFLLCFLGFGTLIACGGSGATVVDPGNQDPPISILPGAGNQDPPTNSQRPPSNQGSSSSSVGATSAPVGGGQGGAGNPGGGRPGGDSGSGNVAGSGTGTCGTADFCQGCDLVNDCLDACNCINQVAGTAENCATDCAAQ